MALTYEPIATTTLSSTSSTITFSSIPSTYTDLVLICSLKGTASLQYKLQFNNDTATNYSVTLVGGNGSTAESYRTTSYSWITPDYYYSATTNGGVSIINLMNYTNTSTYKTALIRTSNADTGVSANVGLWRSTSAINRVDLTTVSSTFASGSTFTLYGVKAA